MYRRNKYKATKCELDGIRFDSKKEMKRYQQLLELQNNGEISNLELQIPFELIPKQMDNNGKVAERACKYIADFKYTDSLGNTHVEDAKGVRTEVYKIKKKLMLFRHNIKVEEV